VRWLAHAENAFAAAAVAMLVFITLAVCAEVLFRYGFNRPIAWVVEVSEYALLWITFLGAPFVLRLNGHVRVDILLQHLSPTMLRWCGFLSSIAGMVSAAVLVGFGASVTWTAYLRGSFKPTGIDVPTWIVVIVIPLGGLLLFLRFARMFAEYWSRSRDFGEEHAH